MRKLAILTILSLISVASFAQEKTKQSVYEDLDYKTMEAMEGKYSKESIAISDKDGNLLREGIVVACQTDNWNYAKIEILSINKEARTINIKFRNYNYEGKLVSESDNLSIKYTYTWDLDKNTDDSERYEKDIWMEYQSADESEEFLLIGIGDNSKICLVD